MCLIALVSLNSLEFNWQVIFLDFLDHRKYIFLILHILSTIRNILNVYLILGTIKDITILWCHNGIFNNIFRTYDYFLKAY